MTVERSLTQVFRKNRTDFDARGRTTIAGSQCVFNLLEDFLFVKFDSRTMESRTSAAVSEFAYTTHVPYAAS